MKERPILFSAPMVRALLDGRKTQTRRKVRGHQGCGPAEYEKYCSVHGAMPNPCPYGAPGDRLWVRETWARVIRRRVTSEEAWWPGRMEWPGIGDRPHGIAPTNAEHHVIIYRADGEMPGGFPEPWQPSIFMHRSVSRITLEVTDVRVERLQDISLEDCAAEGVEFPERARSVANYAALWESIHGPDSWAANPWVWVISFKRVL